MLRDLSDGRLLTLLALAAVVGMGVATCGHQDNGPTDEQMRRDSLAAHVATRHYYAVRDSAERRTVDTVRITRAVARTDTAMVRFQSELTRGAAVTPAGDSVVALPLVRAEFAKVAVAWQAERTAYRATLDTARAIIGYYQQRVIPAADSALAAKDTAIAGLRMALEARTPSKWAKVREGVVWAAGGALVALVAVVGR